MERAQDTFKKLMKDGVAPSLRQLGFKGSGQEFVFPSETHWATLGFQKSAWGDSQEVRFTINVTVVAKRAWEDARASDPELGPRPAPNTIYGAPTWSSRIGRLLPHDLDHWWAVQPGTPIAALADDVVSAVRDYAVPEMRRQIEGAPDARPPLWQS